MTDDEFFIGWQGRASEQTGRRVRSLAVAAAVIALVLGGGMAALQRTIGPAKWEYGDVRTFSGVLLPEPVPTLVTDEPEASSGAAVFFLVNPQKFGFDAAAAGIDGPVATGVELRGTLLHREGQAMIEVVPGSVVRRSAAESPADVPAVEELGEHTLVGEIVDSKCFLGAMNPGVLKPHRACAILCLRGGIPPVLAVRSESGAAAYYLLVRPDGAPLNNDVLDFVAEPVEVRGRVSRLGGRLVIRADPGSIRRLP